MALGLLGSCCALVPPAALLVDNNNKDKDGSVDAKNDAGAEVF
jgi:hypothetical protein